MTVKDGRLNKNAKPIFTLTALLEEFNLTPDDTQLHLADTDTKLAARNILSFRRFQWNLWFV